MWCVIDIETTGVEIYGADKAQITVLGMYIPENDKYVQVQTKETFREFLWTLPRDTKFLYQNGKFDTSLIFERWGIDLPIDEDTMLLAYVYDMGKRKSLKELAERYCGAKNWDVDNKTKMTTSENAERFSAMLAYNRLDCYWTWSVFLELRTLINAHADRDIMWRLYYSLVIPSYRAYRNIERRGIQLDVPTLQQRIGQYKVERDDLENRLATFKDINFNSTKQLADYFINELGLPILERTPTGAPSMGVRVLETYSEMDNVSTMAKEVVTTLMKFKRVDKDLGTFLEPWLENADEGGRIHPQYNIDTVRTGRTSSQRPNLQQVPRDKNLRALFCAAPGYVLAEADYSQLELRVAAHYADDPEMKRIYREGGDIHKNTAAKVNRIPLDQVTKSQRNAAKAINFGFLYGMGAKHFGEYAEVSYGAKFTERESVAAREEYFRSYPKLLDWHEKQRRLARLNGGVYSAWGRFRKLENVHSGDFSLRGADERCAINTPVQSTGSDFLVASMVEMELAPESRDMGLRCVGTVHDSMLIEVPEGIENEGVAYIKGVMSNPKLADVFGVKLNVELEADVGVGNWGTK